MAPNTKNEATRTAHSSAVEMTSCSGYTSLEEGIKKMLVSAEEEFSKDQSPLPSIDFTTKKTQERDPALLHSNPVVDFISLSPASCSDMLQCRDRQL